MAVFNARYACAGCPARLPQSASSALCCAKPAPDAARPPEANACASGRPARRASCAERSGIAKRSRDAARQAEAAYMPKIIKRLRNFGYRVPFLRRRFELEDILLVGVAVGGSFAVVLGWILWVHWRIL